MILLESIGWVGLTDTEPGAAASFLAAAFGLKTVGQERNPQVVLLPSGQTIKVFDDGRPGQSAPRPPAGFLVADLDAAVHRALAHGAQLVGDRKGNDLGAEWQHLCLPTGQVIDLTYRPRAWLSQVRQAAEGRL